jgi:hypothetical protein
LQRLLFLLEISMPQILRGYFDVPNKRPSRTGNRAQSSAREFSPERYHLDNNRRRVLVGLTPAETREFETLDSLDPSDASGRRVAWTFGGQPTTSREKRWLELYTKQEEAWKSLREKAAAGSSR